MAEIFWPESRGRDEEAEAPRVDEIHSVKRGAFVMLPLLEGTSLVKKNDKPVAVGDRVLVNLHHGKFEEGTVKAIIARTDGLHFQVDLGEDRTALVHEWQIRKE